MREQALAYIFGRDVFISYARSKGLAYARGLASTLRERDQPLSVYFDQWKAAPGADLPPSLLRALRRSRVLAVVATEEALQSAHVAKEIETFAALGRSIVAVDDGCLARARQEKRCWPAVLNGVWVRETAIVSGAPAVDVVQSIADVVGDARQERHLENITRWAVLLIITAVAVALVTAVVAQQQAKRAVAAAGAVARMEKRREEAEKKSRAAEAQRAAAEHTARIAAGQAKLALAQQKAAEEQKRIAEQLGHALTLANDAATLDKETPANLPRIALFAAKALEEANHLHVQSLQVNQAARGILNVMPVVCNPVSDYQIPWPAQTSPDGTLVAIVEEKQVTIINLVTGHSAVLADSGSFVGAAFSGDGRHCAAAARNGDHFIIRVWNVESGMAEGKPSAVAGVELNYCIDFTGDHIALRNARTETLSIIDVRSGEPAAELKMDHIKSQMAFSPTDPLIVFSDGDQLLQWRWQSDRQPSRIGSEEDNGSGFLLLRLLFTHKGELAVTVFQADRERYTLAFWSLSNGAHRKWRRERDHFDGLALAQDDSLLAAWDNDSIAVYSIADGEQRKVVSFKEAGSVDISSVYLAAAGSGLIKVFDMDTLLELDRINDEAGTYSIHINGSRITAITANGVLQWGNNGRTVNRLNAQANDLAFLPDEEVLVELSDRTWPRIAIMAADGTPLPSWVDWNGKETTIAAASHRRVLLGDHSGNVTVYTPAGALPSLIHESSIQALAVSRSSRYVAVATKENVYVWNDWVTLHPNRIKLKNAHEVTAVAFGAKDDELVTGSQDGVVQVWNWLTGIAKPPMKHGGQIESLSFDRKGTTIASAGADTRVILWDTRSGAKRELLHDSRVTSAAFDPSGDYVGTISEDAFFRIWYVGGPKPPEVITRIQFWGIGKDHIAFSPSGRTVAFGGWLALSIWKPKDLRDALCQRVNCSASTPAIPWREPDKCNSPIMPSAGRTASETSGGF